MFAMMSRLGLSLRERFHVRSASKSDLIDASQLNDAVCYSRPLASQQTAGLFDYFVGNGVHLERDIEAERPSGLEIDDEFEPARLHHRQNLTSIIARRQ